MATIAMYNNINVDNAFNPLWVAVAAGGTTANSAADPTSSWTARTLPSSSTWTWVCYGDKLIVAIANGTAAGSSPDGITWTARTLPTSVNWQSVTYASGTFVAVASGSDNSATSSDGVTWAAGGSLPSASSWFCVTSSGSTCVAVAGGPAVVSGAISNNAGTSWTGFAMPSGQWRSVVYGNNMYVAVSYGSNSAAYSYDGTTWNSATMPSTAGWSSVCYGGGLFVAVAWNSNLVAVSSNGISWTLRNLSATANWNSVSYGISSVQGLGVFMATSYGATTGSYSYDGYIWMARALATSANWNCNCWNPIAWNSGDTLTINNKATITVNTNQTKFWKTVTGNYGVLNIVNSGTSSGSCNTFAMGRVTGFTANDVTPQSGLFTISISGTLVEIGSGTGIANQSFTVPYTDYVSSIWVETASGSNNYEIWNNVTGAFGPYMKMFGIDGLDTVFTGTRGNYFVQSPAGNPINIMSLTSGATTGGSYYVTCTTTTGIYPGAIISGAALSPSTVVNRVVNSTTLELNAVATTTLSSLTWTVFNPVQAQLVSTISVGNGVSNGNVVPSGARVKIPNIMITDRTSAGLLNMNNQVECYINMSNGGIISAQNCLFGDSYVNLNQAKSIYLRNVGFGYKFALSECYNVDIDGVGTAATPTYWVYGVRWVIRDMRYGTLAPDGYANPAFSCNIALSYIHNASIKNWHNVVYNPPYFSGTTLVYGIDLNNTTGALFQNVKFVTLQPRRITYGLYMSSRVYSCTFSGVELYGAIPLYIGTSDSNTFNNVTYSTTMSNVIRNFASSMRIYQNPQTLSYLQDGTPYFFKVRSYRSWADRSEYFESNEYSATTFSGGWQFPDYISIRPTETVPGSITLDWVRRDPLSATIGYQIFRSTSQGFTTRDNTTRIWDTATAGTVTYADTTSVVTGTRYYYRFRKYNYLQALAGCSAASASYNLTTTQTWTTRTLTSANWQSVSYGNGMFVAVSSGSTNANTSPDGTTWTARTLPANTNWSSVCYGKKLFVAVAYGSNIGAVSSDLGVNWTQTTLPSSTNWQSVAYGNGTFVAIAKSSTAVATSTDGTIWTLGNLPTASGWQSVCFGNNTFVVVGYNSNSSLVSYDNGANWTAGALPSISNWTSITYGNNKFVAVAYGSNIAASSSDGLGWTGQTLSASTNWQSVAFGDGLFTAIAYNGTAASTSYDTVTWTARTLSVSANWQSVTYGMGIFAAVSIGSTNGSTSTYNFKNIYNLGGFVITSGSNIVRNLVNNVYAGMFYPGQLVFGQDIASGTTVLSIEPSGRELVLSSPCISSSDYGVITIPAQNNPTMGLNNANLHYGTTISGYTTVSGLDDPFSLVMTNPATSPISAATVNFQTFTESPELTCVPRAYPIASNYCTYSRDFSNAAWQKTNITVTTNQYLSPSDLSWGTSTADRLAATSSNGTVVQDIPTLPNTSATTAYIWARADQASGTTSTGVPFSLSWCGTTADYTADYGWRRYTVSATTTGTTCKFTITVKTNGTSIIATDAQVSAGSTFTPVITTTTSATLNPCATPLTTMYAICRKYDFSGYDKNQGIEVTIGTAATGALWSEIHMSTTAGFTPSGSNCVATTYGTAIDTSHIQLVGSNYNNLINVSKLKGGGAAHGNASSLSIINVTTFSTNNLLSNFDIDVSYCNVYAGPLFYLGAAAHNNIFHNINLGYVRSYVASIGPITSNATNAITGNRLQNIKFMPYDLGISNQMLSTMCRGIPAGRAVPATNATTYSLGSTTDGIATAYTAVYGSQFTELYFSDTEGALHVNLQDTQGTNKPYTVISGSPIFSNTGRVYLTVTGTSVEYTWPHKIKGVSGFRNFQPKLYGVDLGSLADWLDGLKVEYSLDTTGSGYAAYKRLTVTNLVSESVNASTGFYMKLRFSTMPFMKYTTTTNNFVLGEIIRGATGSGTARVIEDYDNGTAGTLILDTVSGSFIGGETIVRHSDGQARATNVATNSYGLGPSFTSYITNLMIYTSIDKSVLYPALTPAVSITGLKPYSEIRVYTNDGIELAGIESIGESTSWDATYDYYSDFTGYIVIMSLNYQVLRFDNLNFGPAGISIIAQQNIDRQYLNP